MATGLSFDGDIRAVAAEAELLAPLAFLCCSYPPEFSLLLVCELGLQSASGALALACAGSLLDGLLDGFANAAFGVASVGRHGEDENVVERTAYCPRLRVRLGVVIGRTGNRWCTPA